MTQGAKANKSGKVLETTVEGTLRGHGYFQVCLNVPKQQQREYLLNSTLLPKRYARNVYVGTGIYQNDLYADFYVTGSPAFPSGLIIECKWQETPGSTDEKFPFLNLNIQFCYPVPTVVVIGGEGMRQGAMDWFKNQVGSNQNLLAVHKVERFIAWANEIL